MVADMSGKELANLSTVCLRKLSDVNVRAVSITCDGPSADFAMARSLACP